MSVTYSIDVRIAQCAGRQHGLITTVDLRRLRVGRSAVQRRVASGLLRQVQVGVFACGPTAVSMGSGVDHRADSWQMAVVLRGGDGAALSHAAAAARLGAWRRWNARITVTAPFRIAGHATDVGRHVRTELPADQVTIVAGIPTTTAERTVCDLGVELTAWQVCHVIHELRFLGLLDLAKVERMLEERSGRRGVAVVRRAIRLYRAGSAGTRSWSEDHLLDGLLQTDLPEPLVNNRRAVDVQGIEPDFAWPRVRLVVEVDGATAHDQPHKREQDQRRDDVLRAAGWVVLRFDASRVRRARSAVIREITKVYRARLAAAAARSHGGETLMFR